MTFILSFNYLFRRSIFSKLHRPLALAKGVRKYNGDGKTTIISLSKEEKNIILIRTYGPYGFRLNNGIFVIGPIAIFPKHIFQWDVANALDITMDSLSLFLLVEPKIDILIIGKGDKNVKVDQTLQPYLLKNKLYSEILPTERAVSLYNYLAFDNRKVAAALIPPTEIIEKRYIQSDLNVFKHTSKEYLEDIETQFHFEQNKLKEKYTKDEISEAEYKKQINDLRNKLFPKLPYPRSKSDKNDV